MSFIFLRNFETDYFVVYLKYQLYEIILALLYKKKCRATLFFRSYTSNTEQDNFNLSCNVIFQTFRAKGPIFGLIENPERNPIQ